MTVSEANDARSWDAFLGTQTFHPFLQSWTMGEVYRSIDQDPVRLVVHEGDEIAGICQAIVVPARRGRHLAVHYGPIMSSKLAESNRTSCLDSLFRELRRIATLERCAFIRLSPFWLREPNSDIPNTLPSPLHLLAEHVWYLPLRHPDPWSVQHAILESATVPTEDELLMNMRKTTRNLIRRAERDGVEIVASADPENDVETFIALHEETRKRHGFTPYSDAFFRAQVRLFAARGECTVYLARFEKEVIASSIHIHTFGETSYHHGASSFKHAKIPASYLLQWRAITDAIRRGDHIYNFWGIAPEGVIRHPFLGVTLFKTGFGGTKIDLVHCIDIPLNPLYRLTRLIEQVRKWRRGF
ncbi:MAG: peptidoglycan bridge formation glycyltransferase FemA/FemB family protein [Candidatus Peribacteraceae bacterium]|nr:peptidoglycan bridge formation glycyltransferase FemA/FemB family protein [Candidatus Peribacteraceae bacterium]